MPRLRAIEFTKRGSNANLTVITINIQKPLKCLLDSLVNKGMFASRSEAIRIALYELLDNFDTIDQRFGLSNGKDLIKEPHVQTVEEYMIEKGYTKIEKLVDPNFRKLWKEAESP